MRIDNTFPPSSPHEAANYSHRRPEDEGRDEEPQRTHVAQEGDLHGASLLP